MSIENGSLDSRAPAERHVNVHVCPATEPRTYEVYNHRARRRGGVSPPVFR